MTFQLAFLADDFRWKFQLRILAENFSCEFWRSLAISGRLHPTRYVQVSQLSMPCIQLAISAESLSWELWLGIVAMNCSWAF